MLDNPVIKCNEFGESLGMKGNCKHTVLFPWGYLRIIKVAQKDENKASNIDCSAFVSQLSSCLTSLMQGIHLEELCPGASACFFGWVNKVVNTELCLLKVNRGGRDAKVKVSWICQRLAAPENLKWGKVGRQGTGWAPFLESDRVMRHRGKVKTCEKPIGVKRKKICNCGCGPP